MGNKETKSKIEKGTEQLILFKRFKKKTLSLLNQIYPEDLEILEEIKYKKLCQCISNVKLTKQNLEEKTIQHDHKYNNNFKDI